MLLDVREWHWCFGMVFDGTHVTGDKMYEMKLYWILMIVWDCYGCYECYSHLHRLFDIN